MSISYIGNNNQVVTGATECDLGNPAGSAAGDLIVSVFAFENVAAGSGPWIVPNLGQLTTDYIGPSTGWDQVCWQAPSVAGVGIEVWCARLFSGTHQWAKFAASQNCTGVNAAYRGIYDVGNPVSNGTVRVAPTAQVTGNQPAAPSVVANASELVVACGGDLMTAAKFGTPSGFTNRVDVQRAGAGTVEATLADTLITTAGATGPITFPNAANASSTAGATATLAVRPAPTTTGVGAVVSASMPEDLDLPDGYVLTWAAIDPVTGADVAGVTVSEVSIFGTILGQGTGGNVDFGPFMLVPGPGA